MIPAAFDYEVADSAAHALSLLAEFGEDAKLLAGGQSLLRLAQPVAQAPRRRGACTTCRDAAWMMHI